MGHSLSEDAQERLREFRVAHGEWAAQRAQARAVAKEVKRAARDAARAARIVPVREKKPPYQKKGRNRLYRSTSDVLDRLWGSLTVTDTGCWEAPVGKRSRYGYGMIYLGNRGGPYPKQVPNLYHMSRLVWQVIHAEPIPAGMLICHHCDNPPCCNPDHLFIGTASDNVADMVAKGRNRAARETPPVHNTPTP